MNNSLIGTGKNLFIHGRVFKITFLNFSNGCFLSITEGIEERIGSLTLSMRIHDKVEHTIIIPENRGGVFSSILSELVASVIQGLIIVSLYLLDRLSSDVAKDLLKEIRDFLNTNKK